MRHRLIAVIVMALSMVASSDAIAQQMRRNTIQRPRVSPYVNLLRDRDPAIEYLGVIRPQIEANRLMQMQAQQVERLQATQRASDVKTGAALRSQQEQISTLSQRLGFKRAETGHRVTFMNTRTFFPGARTGGAVQP